MACECSDGYIRIDSLPFTPLMGPHTPENDTCYQEYTSAYYAAQTIRDGVIASNLDPACDECVEADKGTSAMIDFNLAEAEAAVAYWECRKKNG